MVDTSDAICSCLEVIHHSLFSFKRYQIHIICNLLRSNFKNLVLLLMTAPYFCLVYFLEIPDFLTKEECEHIIRKATEIGLTLSEVKLPDEEITTDKFASENLFNLVKKMRSVFVLLCLFVCYYHSVYSSCSAGQLRPFIFAFYSGLYT